MITNWTPTELIVDTDVPFVTLVAVDDIASPTQELRMRLEGGVVSTRVLPVPEEPEE